MDNNIEFVSLNNTILNKTLNVSVDDEFFKQAEGDITKGLVQAQVCCDSIVNDSFHFNIHAKGAVFTPCDICLDDVELRIDVNEELIVTLADEEIDDGDVIYVDREHPILNLTDIVYQFVVVNLPIKRVHEPGMCNDVMMNEYKNHLVARSNDELNDTDAINTSEDNTNCDPRWNELKKLLNK